MIYIICTILYLKWSLKVGIGRFLGVDFPEFTSYFNMQWILGNFTH
jgi:hypothetical protein